MKILITGGTGFVGREVVQQLRGAGHIPRLLVRTPDSWRARELAAQFAAELREGDVLDPDSLPTAMDGCDAVIHLVGIISEVGHQTYQRVHRDGTCNIVAAAKHAGLRRFIHMSALGTRAHACSHYHQTKWAAEQAVRESGLAWTIFRPSIIYGPGDGFVNLFARLSRFSPILPLIGGGKTRLQPISVGDVARSFSQSVTEARSIGKTLDLCGPQILSLEEIVAEILKATSRRRLLLPLPFAIANLQATLAEFVFAGLFGKAPPLNRDQVKMLREDNVGDEKTARELFQLSGQDFGAGIRTYLRVRR